VRGPSPAICPAFKRSSSFHHVRLARSAAHSARRRLLHLGHLRQALRGSRGRQPPGGRPLCAIATAASATAASACVSMSPGDIERGAPAPSLVFTRVSPCCAGGRQPKARAVRRLRSTARFDGSRVQAQRLNGPPVRRGPSTVCSPCIHPSKLHVCLRVLPSPVKFDSDRLGLRAGLLH
jgi:hypothetical protein